MSVEWQEISPVQVTVCIGMLLIVFVAMQISMLEYRDKLYNEILKRKKEQRRMMKGREREPGTTSSSRTRSTRHARHSDGSRYR